MSAAVADVGIVVPTVGRPSLQRLLVSLASDGSWLPAVVVVDDRRDAGQPLRLDVPGPLVSRVSVVRGRAMGPAAARNDGWRCLRTQWIAFLDDDVVVPDGWLGALAADLGSAADDVGGVAGRIVVPRPAGRPADWERNTVGLESARWATADLAYRRAALVEVAGFDERFPRAYREDADLALRVRKAGYRLVVGNRHVLHPVRPAGPWVSVRVQRGNADDALMRRLHGPEWRALAEVPRGRRARHVAVTAAGLVALAGAATRARNVAAIAGCAWLAGTGAFATERIAPGPRTVRDVATMVATSVAIPPAAVWHWLRGAWRWRAAGPWPDRPAAVLLDRDGTLVEDVPYNGDPERVVPKPGAREALALLRERGVRLGVVTNQSGVASGRLSEHDVAAVNERMEALLGPFDVVAVCPHGPSDGCDCRKPEPGMITTAAAALGAHPRHCVVIGDIGGDVEAAARAGAKAILVPTGDTRPDEISAAPYVVRSLPSAARLALSPEFLAGRR